MAAEGGRRVQPAPWRAALRAAGADGEPGGGAALRRPPRRRRVRAHGQEEAGPPGAGMRGAARGLGHCRRRREPQRELRPPHVTRCAGDLLVRFPAACDKKDVSVNSMCQKKKVLLSGLRKPPSRPGLC